MINRIILSIIKSIKSLKYSQNHADHFCLTDSALADIENGLSDRVREVSDHALSKDFLRFLNQKGMMDAYLDGEIEDEKCALEQEYEAMVTKDNCAYLKDHHKGLMEVIRQRCDQYHAVINEMLERLELRYEDVCTKLLEEAYFTKIIKVDVNSGDVHNDGRRTMIIHTDQGVVVYKPHDVRIDAASAEMIRRFFPDVTLAPDVCVYEGYGFVEFIQNAPVNTKEDAEKYFYNLGGLTAMIQMLGSLDMHHSNIISSGIYPVIIDYEMIIPMGRIFQEKSIGQDMQYSLMYSCLMPCRRGNVEMSILFAKDEANVGGPKVDGEYKCISDYPEMFLEGFADIYRRCVKHRERIKDFWRAQGDVTIRFIYRGTNVYDNLQKKIYESDLLGNEKLETELFKQLSLATKRSGLFEESKLITEAEICQMIRGDIPYLYYKTDTCDLWSDGRIVYPGFFERSALDTLIDRIDHLSEADLKFEIQLLQKAMTRVIRHNADGYDKVLVSDLAEISDEQLRDEVEKIFREIADDAVYTPSGQICWFGTNYFLETGMNMLDKGFISGIMGLQVFFAAVYRVSSFETTKTKAKELVDYLTQRVRNRIGELELRDVIHPNEESISYGNGLAGKILGCYLTGIYMEDASYLQLCRQMIALLEKAELSYANTDIIKGMAGALKVLCKYDDLYDLPGSAKVCGELSDCLVKAAGIVFKKGKLWRTLSPAWALSGAGHGQAGIGAALYLAGKRLNRPDLIQASETAFDFERHIYHQKLGVWPDLRGDEKSEGYLTGYCSGAPGIGIEILGMDTDVYMDLLEKAIGSTLKEPLTYKDFLCCGNSAQVEFLLDAGIKMSRPDLVKAARTRMAQMIDRSRKNGFYCCASRSLTETFNPCLFYGTAGIGYEMLRILQPEIIHSVLI